MEGESIAEVLRWRRPAKLRVLADLTRVMADLRIDAVRIYAPT